MATPKFRIMAATAALAGVAIFSLYVATDDAAPHPVLRHADYNVGFPEPETHSHVRPPSPAQDFSAFNAGLTALASAHPEADAAQPPAAPDPRILKPLGAPRVNVYRVLGMTPAEEEQTRAVLAHFRKEYKTQPHLDDETAAKAQSRQIEQDATEDLKAILGPERGARVAKILSGEEAAPAARM